MRTFTHTTAAVALTCVALLGCGSDSQEATDQYAQADQAAPADTAAAAGEIPISTESAEAREEFLAGRELAEGLRFADAREHFEKAVLADPAFALGYLSLANTAPSAQAFFDNLGRAVELVSNASPGERNLILAADAGAKSRPADQAKLLRELIAMHPGDKRAHNALAGLYFGQQKYGQAIEQYKEVTTLDPNWSQPYNQLGYAQRFLNDYDAAETSFLKYIELLPNEPNPYDSYAELLMKQGRHTESIANYRKALTADPGFVASYIGIANNHIFEGEYEAARKALDELTTVARDDGQRRQALLWKTASYLHEGDTAMALSTARDRLAIVEKAGDAAGMSGDLNQIGTILLEAGKTKEAQAEFEAAQKAIEVGDVPHEVKAASARNHLQLKTRAALAVGDLATAKEMATAYRAQADEHGIPFELRLASEVEGLCALHEKAYDKARAALAKANQRDPRVLFALARATEGGGDHEAAGALLKRTANFNELNFNYAFVRNEALAATAKN